MRMSERDITQSPLSPPPLTLWRDEQLRAPVTSPPTSWARRASEALIALTLAWLALCLADPSLALSAQVSLGEWWALSLSFGLLWVGVTARALSLHRSAVMGGARALGASGPYDRGLTSRGVSAISRPARTATRARVSSCRSPHRSTRGGLRSERRSRARQRAKSSAKAKGLER